MRPNYAQDAPPTSIEVGGFAYPCNTDYRVWLEVVRLLREIDLRDESEAGRQRAAETLVEIERIVFGGWLKDESPMDVLAAVADFSKGYPMAPIQDTGDSREPAYSFEYDLNAIIIAIRNQSGIDLSWRRTEPFHWWEFLLEFHTLCGNHYILNLMEARTYRGKDRDLLRRKYACQLPPEYTAAERAELEDFSAQFATGWEALEETMEEDRHEDRY